MKQYELTYNKYQTFLESRKDGLVHTFEANSDLDAKFLARVFGMENGADLVSLVQVERREVTRYEEDRKNSQILDESLSVYSIRTDIPQKTDEYEIFRTLDDLGNIHRDLEIKELFENRNKIPRKEYSFDIPEIKEVPRKPYPGHSSPDF